MVSVKTIRIIANLEPIAKIVGCEPGPSFAPREQGTKVVVLCAGGRLRFQVATITLMPVVAVIGVLWDATNPMVTEASIPPLTPVSYAPWEGMVT